MTAVYKRELRSYLTSMVGYLFIFFILLLTGIYFSAYQLAAAYPKFEYTLSALDLCISDQRSNPDHESSCRRTETEDRPAASDIAGFCRPDRSW